MKKLFLFSTSVVVLLAACSKEETSKEFCVECTQTTTITSNSDDINQEDPSVMTFERCGITQTTLDYMLNTGNVSSSQTTGNIVITTAVELDCNKL